MHRGPRLLAAALPVAAVAVAAALAGPTSATGGAQPATDAPGERRSETAQPSAGRHEQTAPTAVPAVGRRRARAAASTAIVRVEPGATLTLRTRPAGPLALRLDDKTDFGSPQTLGVVARRGRWLGVTTPELPNGQLAWVDARAAPIAISRTRWSIVVDVSDRRSVLRRGRRPVRRLPVAVGRRESPTPTGRFAVTDKLPGSAFGPYYGCCILAISATQPSPPPGWTGGNRMAIHGAEDPATVGLAASAGCLRAADADLRTLMRHVPLGAPVVIRR